MIAALLLAGWLFQDSAVSECERHCTENRMCSERAGGFDLCFCHNVLWDGPPDEGRYFTIGGMPEPEEPLDMDGHRTRGELGLRP